MTAQLQSQPRDLGRLLARLCTNHKLGTAPASYVEAFKAAARNVYPEAKIEKFLQDKFFIPNDARYRLDSYLQSAAELSVQNHIKANPAVRAFDIEKKINPPKDVDVYYEVGPTRVALEIKCAEEPTNTAGALVLRTAGRVPAHTATFLDLKGRIETAHPSQTLELGKNKDNTLKTFLVEANNKFATSSRAHDVNLLFVACGYYFDIQNWWYYLYERQGLFTSESFHPPSEYALVDAVILSNVKYLHLHAAHVHDWTLQNAFLLPLINPFRSPRNFVDTIRESLSVFDHHLDSFKQYTVKSDDPRVPDFILNNVKVNSYVAEHLREEDRARYFPVVLHK